MTSLTPILALVLQAQLATVEGIVTKPGVNEPLAGARVTLNPVMSAPPTSVRTWAAVTEDDGRFTLHDVAPGNYNLTAESVGYGRAVYGQRRPGGPGSTLSIGAGQRLTELRLSMIPTGAIAGRITGRNGEPAVSASVQALKYAYENGKRTLVAAQTAMTNDLGEYRLFWLPAGQYLVGATVNDSVSLPPISGITPPGFGPYPSAPALPLELSASALFNESSLTGPVVHRILDDGTLQEGAWAPIFYPAASETRFATPIDVMPGATVNGVNIAISPSRVQRIRGQVVADSSTPATSPVVTLLAQTPLTGVRALNSGVRVANDFSFEISGVKPGAYILQGIDARSGLMSAPLRIEVGDRDIENLRILLTPGIMLGGRVVLDTSDQNAKGTDPLLGVRLILAQGSPALPSFALQIQSGTGSFVVNNVSPGNYQIQIVPLSNRHANAKAIYVKSVRFGSSDARNGIQITGATHDRLEVVLTTETGSLGGTVSKAGQESAAGATVVLVPEGARRNAGLYNASVSDAAGRFRFPEVPVGDYTVFAWDDVETGAWQDLDFMRPYESRGHAVHVSGIINEDIQLLVIVNP